MSTEFDPANFINILLGGALGGAASWCVSHWFARKSSQELQTIFRSFAVIAEDRGFVKWARNDKGEITSGRIIELAIHEQANATDSYSCEVIRAQPAAMSGTGTVDRVKGE